MVNLWVNRLYLQGVAHWLRTSQDTSIQHSTRQSTPLPKWRIDDHIPEFHNRVMAHERNYRPPSGASTRVREYISPSVLDFSPDGKLAVVAVKYGNTAVVLNLESGVLQLIIDVGMKVYGLG